MRAGKENWQHLRHKRLTESSHSGNIVLLTLSLSLDSERMEGGILGSAGQVRR